MLTLHQKLRINMIPILIIIFTLGYIAITLEHTIKINKTATALITAVLCWTFIIINASNKEQIIEQLSHHLSSISEIVFFFTWGHDYCRNY